MLAPLLSAAVAVSHSPPTAQDSVEQVGCDEFLQMKVLEEVKAVAQGRVPRECRDRKAEQQRRDQRRRAAAQRGGSAGPSGHLYAAIATETRPLRQLLQAWPLAQLKRPLDYRLPIPSLWVPCPLSPNHLCSFIASAASARVAVSTTADGAG
jgi:hypothetical protein